ncbi:GNAT family N-acetyltransferase [Rossellomorea vietnamensis]|uniref:GNAT family N-acetyltransferase n=1 Tax=Rossellomorea vietnamensis TaxID=218284 RepID=A0A5D4MCI0_9BACI|nr:GNAT family N-acetyltransferase [Rossellomorea vietnamensis]TYR99382.1 GNAT family N-acetyltransferase [Rossellomorea vietnamensis]
MQARLKDAIGIAKVQVDTWKTTYGGLVPESYLQAMTYESRERKWKEILKKGTVYIAKNELDEIVGFSCGGEERSGNYPDYHGELYAIYILKEYQRSGLGKSLVKPVISDLINRGIFSMVVIVLEKNPSKSFYESLHGKKIDTLTTEIAGKPLQESVYGWKDINQLL